MWPPNPAGQEHLFGGGFSMPGFILPKRLGRTGRPHRAALTKGDRLYLTQRPFGSISQPFFVVIVVAHGPERQRPFGSA
jgi:hypothetical protein